MNKFPTPESQGLARLQSDKQINKLGNPACSINYYKSNTGDSSYRCQFIEVLNDAFLPWLLKEANVAELLKRILSLDNYRTNISNSVSPIDGIRSIYSGNPKIV